MSFWRRREESLDREIEDYLDRQMEENIARGMPPEEARIAARRKLGPVLRVKEDTRAAWGWLWLERLWQDLRHSRRMLAKNPGFTLVAVLSLGIGVGANCAMFSMADMMLFRPLPVPRPTEVLTLGSTNFQISASQYDFLRASYPDYVDVRDHSQSFAGLTRFDESGRLRVGEGCSGERGHLLCRGFDGADDLCRVRPRRVTQTLFKFVEPGDCARGHESV